MTVNKAEMTKGIMDIQMLMQFSFPQKNDYSSFSLISFTSFDFNSSLLNFCKMTLGKTLPHEICQKCLDSRNHRVKMPALFCTV